MCGNFGQISLGTEARIGINPNRLYPVEAAMRRERRFSISVLSRAQRDVALNLARVRRRAVHKPKVVGVHIATDERHGIPFAPDCYRILFCEVEQILDTGDHTLMISRVLETRTRDGWQQEQPLLYQEIAGAPSSYPKVQTAIRWTLAKTGAMERLQTFLRKRRGAVPVDLPGTTYENGGQTDDEVAQILRWGGRDTGRIIAPPERPPSALNRKLSVAVVGLGQWGSFHCRLLKDADPNVDLYVCGRNAENAERLARATGAKGVILGVDRAIEDPRIEALSLALPHHMHAEIAARAAGGGKHVLVEKPIATTLTDADRMIEAARAARTILMVAEDMHFRPAIRQATKMIAQGDIGEPLYLIAHAGGIMRPRGWKADPALMGGGILMDMGVHYVRAMRLLMGEPDEVMAARSMQIDTKMHGEDSVQLWFRSRAGWHAQMLFSWAGPRGHAPDLTVCGDRGVLHIWPGAGYVDLYPAEPRPLVQMLSYVRPYSLAEKLVRPEMQRLRVQIPDADRQGYVSEMQEFIAAVAEKRPPVSPAEDARRDLAIVLQAYEALRTSVWTGVTAP
jgi:predicted dehydrogenase/flavin reductase (DIM6/NTAB) family NADH-FMN oxidoreductase RutF